MKKSIGSLLWILFVCPVGMKDLSDLKISHWGFDGKIHSGEMMVHKDVAKEVSDIFSELFKQKFPIKKMELIDQYKGDDASSMEANNTSAFNCRAVTGSPGVFSEHSYGKAIDINPVQNPYVRGAVVAPPAGKKYLNRKKVRAGMIVADAAVVKAFKKRGWKWGGDWKTLKDYQHFEKVR